jgi:hypothetical protein
MKIVKELWSISELIEKRQTIDPKPQYQRTSVWTNERKAYLIDSILRGYDIPKFYFTYQQGKKGKNFDFEVADGQQRIRAIWEFKDDGYALKRGTIIDKVDLSLMKYSELPKKFKDDFNSYELHISNILKYNIGEVNDLFTRLQKGVTLNPSELRHAMISKIGLHIDKFVTTQQASGFFSDDTKIANIRFKHQEYIDHVIALVHFNNSKDLKAATMAQLYIDFADDGNYKHYFVNASRVLKVMKAINSHKHGVFKNKWAFVDSFWFLYKNIENIDKLNTSKFSALFVEFEKERIKYNTNPEEILNNKKHQFGKILFDYIQSFNVEGANKNNIQVRAEALNSVFNPLISSLKKI